MTALLDLDTLLRAWDGRELRDWHRSPEHYLQSGRQAIALGQPLFGFEIVKEGLAAFPEHAELAYLSALALARSGTRHHAARTVDQLLAHADLDARLRSEALSLAGRIAKDRWVALTEPAARTAAAVQARDRYRQAYQLSSDYFPGINAATLCVMTGEADEGLRLAREVRERCEALAQRETDHWLCATIAEACVLLSERDAAVHWYGLARERAGQRHGDVASMRRQLRLLSEKLDLARELLAALTIPRVVVFSGHMIDAPGRPAPRFPAALAPAIEQAVAAALRDARAGFVYCSAACGADLLFIDQALQNGVEVNIVLPFGREDFVRTSVAFAGDEWVCRFERALERAASVTVCVDEGYLGDQVLYEYGGMMMQGMAMLRARQLESEPLLIAVVAPDEPNRPGGTVANIESWREQGFESCIIDLGALSVAVLPAAAAAGSAAPYLPLPPREPLWQQRTIKTMLFADVVGFSKLREGEAPAFFLKFLGRVAREIESSALAPVCANTWGDGLYIVFDDAHAAADFALRLRDVIGRTDWRAEGLPELAARIGMHSGPVFQAVDPIIQRLNFFGSHVTRAARIEPVTAPGSVFVSEQTAALLEAGGRREFACDYLGSLTMAKGYGTTTLYRLRRAHEDE